MKKYISLLLFSLIALTSGAQSLDTLNPEGKVRWKINNRLKDNSIRAITPADFRSTFNDLVNMTLRRAPHLSIAELRAGRADSAQVIYLNQGVKSGTFRASRDTTLHDDSAMVFKVGSRVFVRDYVGAVNVKYFGADGAGKVVFDAVATAGSNVITSATANFTADLVGTTVSIRAAAAGGKQLVTTVTAVISPTQLQLATNAVASGTGRELNYNWRDQSEAFQKAVNYVIAKGGGAIEVDPGRYWFNGRVYVNPTKQIPVTIRGSTDMVLQDSYTRESFGTTILMTNPGDAIRVNLDATGNGIMTYPQQYYGFAISGITFAGKSDLPGMNAMRVFRTRGNYRNLASSRIDYLLTQDELDASGDATFSDMNILENIRIVGSMFSGVRLIHADNTNINGFYYEAGEPTSKYGLEIFKSTTVNITGILHGVGGNGALIEGGALASIDQCFGVSIQGMHIEDCKLESFVRVNNSGATHIRGIFSQFTNNNAFTLRYAQGVKIENWYSYETRNPGTYDINLLSDQTTNANITFESLNLFSTAQPASQLRRELNINNYRFLGIATREVHKENVPDLRDIRGNKFFNTLPAAANIPFAAQHATGFQITTDDNDDYINQLAFVDNVAYTIKKSAGVWDTPKRLLNGDDLTSINTNLALRPAVVVVTDWNAVPSGFQVLRGTSSATNAPGTGYWQGAQYAANNDANYANQIAWSTTGEERQRYKNNGVWGAWVTMAVKPTTATATYDPASLAPGEMVSTTIAVTGAVLGQTVRVAFSMDLTNDITLNARVSSAGVVTAVFRNIGIAAIDPASGTLTVKVDPL